MRCLHLVEVLLTWFAAPELTVPECLVFVRRSAAGEGGQADIITTDLAILYQIHAVLGQYQDFLPGASGVGKRRLQAAFFRLRGGKMRSLL
ncbi:MAG: hypothetical protein A3F75_11305 [Betaproteobacteria bacterium RIFCSPLOWO2_12_FULL_64_23]|nr:MAG: hypothetical protein A3F75_11305 [Betaproteobacteria bacterium RIFCSPLOWO2_12_FULL_64_23]